MQLDELEKATASLDQFDTSELDRAAVVFAPVGIIISQEDGSIVRINNKACELLGYYPTWDRKAWLKQRGWIAMTHPDDVELDKEYAHKAASGKIKGYKITKRYIGRRDAEVWVTLTIRFYKSRQFVEPLAMVYVEPATEYRGGCAFVEELK